MAHTSHSQRGSAILLVFIAIALFGALAYGLMRGSGGSTNLMKNESEKANATDVQDYSNAVTSAVQRLKLRGCTPAQISFETPNGNNINPNAPTDKRCHVFNVAGAGVQYKQGNNSQKKVFVSSVKFSATLGGIAGADAKCNALASASGVRGYFKAWISDQTLSPSGTFIQSTGPYVLIDGTKIADNWTDLTDGTLLAKINIVETGATVSAGGVFTGTGADGKTLVPSGIYSGDQCVGWTNSTNTGNSNSFYIGTWNASDSGWTASAIVSSCPYQGKLYCFEQ